MARPDKALPREKRPALAGFSFCGMAADFSQTRRFSDCGVTLSDSIVLKIFKPVNRLATLTGT